jgi:hypothetical protein
MKPKSPAAAKNDPFTGGGGRSHQGKMLVVGAVEVEDGGPLAVDCGIDQHARSVQDRPG